MSDLFGEKLSEAFVTEAIQETLDTLDTTPRFVLLAPDEDTVGCRYTLYVEGTPPRHLADALDRALRQNPHYAYCRDLGQLLPLRLFVVAERGFEIFANRQTAQGSTLGGVKPSMVSPISGWSSLFAGAYVSTS